MVVVELRTQFIMKGITLLSAFEWDKATRTLLYGQADYAYDKPRRQSDQAVYTG